MKKKSSYRWLIWIILAVVLIGVALMHILPPYIDRWKSARDYDKLAEAYVNDESEPDDGKQKKKDWWATDVKVEFDKLRIQMLSDGYGLIIRTNLASIIQFCIQETIRNI